MTDAGTYCGNLVLDGYDDWRLPTPLELVSIVDYGRTSPMLDTQTFPNASAAAYWTSAGTSSDASTVHFATGMVSSIPNTSTAYTRCVRGTPLHQGWFKAS